MSNAKIKLELCPCGERPEELYLDDNGWGSKGAQAAGSCCGEWNIVFQTNYHPLDSTECMEIAVEEWNKAAKEITINCPKNCLPWLEIALKDWSICGMNHYRVNGARFLFVSMTKNGRCITEEGVDNASLWQRLSKKALEASK